MAKVRDGTRTVTLARKQDFADPAQAFEPLTGEEYGGCAEICLTEITSNQITLELWSAAVILDCGQGPSIEANILGGPLLINMRKKEQIWVRFTGPSDESVMATITLLSIPRKNLGARLLISLSGPASNNEELG